MAAISLAITVWTELGRSPWLFTKTQTTQSQHTLTHIAAKKRVDGTIALVSNARGLRLEPPQGQGISSSYETPKLVGAGDSNVLQMRQKPKVQCGYIFQTSSTHNKDPAVSVCKSQDSGNIQIPACTKVHRRTNRYGALISSTTCLIQGCDTFWD
jgi:hypothetical protein